MNKSQANSKTDFTMKTLCCGQQERYIFNNIETNTPENMTLQKDDTRISPPC